MERVKRYGLIALVVGAIWAVGRLIPEETMQMWVERAGAFGPVGIVGLTLITNILAPLSGTPIMLAGYLAYGRNIVWLTALAGYLSFFVNFWIARKWGTRVVEKLVGKENLDELNSLVMGKGEIWLFMSRLFHGGLHDFVSYIAGLSDISFLRYGVISTLAIIPGTLVWYGLVLTTDSAEGFLAVTLTMSGVLSTLFVFGVSVFGLNNRWVRRRKDVG